MPAIVGDQDERNVLAILELLLDISSHLQAMEHCIQTCQKAEQGTEKSATALSCDGGEPC